MGVNWEISVIIEGCLRTVLLARLEGWKEERLARVEAKDAD